MSFSKIYEINNKLIIFRKKRGTFLFHNFNHWKYRYIKQYIDIIFLKFLKNYNNWTECYNYDW